MGNIEKTLKNSTISVVGQILTLLLQFVNRRIFIIFLSIEFLGYQSLFSNVFSLLSVAELGLESVISFHLYKEFVNNNKEEIGKLVYLYKQIYRIIAMIVAVLGIALYPLVPYMIKENTLSKSYLFTIYFLQLISAVVGYFLSYRRTVWVANQKEYKCVQCDLVANLVIQVIQLFTLAIFRNYIIYLILQLFTSSLANIFIYFKTNKEYPYLTKKYKITKEDIIKRNFISDIKNLIVHKVCYAIYGGTDNIVISTFCGVRDVALYGNYYMIQRGVMQVLFYKLLNPVQATIGNIVYSKRSKDELWKQFEILDIFSFLFASYIGLGFFLFYQTAITIWMGGQEYLLPESFVIMFSITIYFGAVWEIVYKYRSVFGEYEKDRNCMVVSSILNVLISIFLASILGVTGVQIGTLVAFFPIAYGRICFVVRGFFGKSVLKYFIRHILYFAIVMTEAILISVLAINVNNIYMNLLCKLILWAIVPFVSSYVLFRNNNNYIAMIGYIKQIIDTLLKKIVKRG